MIIESVDVTAFGKLTDYKVSFDGGFNLLEGNNESGKSTLSAFFVYMLYGFSDGEDDGALSERALRTPFAEEETAGSMVFSTADARYRIERHSLLGKNGWRDSFSLRNLTTGEVENEGPSPGERFFGVSRQVFLETAFFGVSRMGAVNGDTVCEAIENIIFSGDERQSVTRAARELNEAADRLFSSEGNGVLLALQKERESLEEQLKTAREREEALYEKEEHLYVNRCKRAEALAELEKFTSLETNYYNAIMIKDYDRLHAMENETVERERAVADFVATRQNENGVPDLAYLTDLTKAKAEYDSARKARELARLALGQIGEADCPVSEEERVLCARVDEAGGVSDVRERTEATQKRERRFAVLCSVCLALLAAALIGAVATWLGDYTAVSVLLSCLGVVALGAGVVLGGEWSRAAKERKKLFAVCDAQKGDAFFALLARADAAGRIMEKWEADRRKASELVELSELSYEEAKERLSSLVSRFGKREADESLVQTAVRVGEEIADFLEKLAERKKSKELADEEVRVLRAKLADQNEIAVRARVAPDDRERYCNQNVEDLRRGVEHFEDMLSKLLCAENQLLTALSGFEVGEASASIAEKILALDERIEKIRETGRIYRLAAEAVAGGGERLRNEISPRLSFGAGNLLYEMTDGKYTDVLADDRMGLSFFTEDGKRDVRHLGDGTAEMAYIALRLSLIGLLYRKELPPLCFDGCTALQDRERALAFLRALRGLTADGRQCFCFTANERERSLADKVFTSYRYLAMEK